MTRVGKCLLNSVAHHDCQPFVLNRTTFKMEKIKLNLLTVLSTSTFVGAVSFGAVLLFSFARRRKSHLPPGPKPLPVIGNAHQIPQKSGWLVFSDWSKKYGRRTSVCLYSVAAISFDFSLKVILSMWTLWVNPLSSSIQHMSRENYWIRDQAPTLIDQFW